jgi:putative nucleotidyltransferase with HDIG domain
MDQEAIRSRIEKGLDRDDVTLPIFNQVALEMQRLITSGNYSLSDIGKVVMRDPGLVSDVLKMANSSFYGGLTPAKTVHEASVRLGAKSIYNLVTALTQKQLYRSKKKAFQTWMKPLWSHALGVAFSSRWLSRHVGLQAQMDEAFMAGLLHDVGKLYVLRVVEDVEKELGETLPVDADFISSIMNERHPDVGERYMMRLNMPEVYCQVAGRHHDAEVSPKPSILNVVRLVNLACNREGIGLKKHPEIQLEASPEAMALKVGPELVEELSQKLKDYIASLTQLLGSG